MKLYALLIGINEYVDNPLAQCVSDVEEMEAYLRTLKSHFEEQQIEKLLDAAATRTNIINAISQVLGTATDDDVAVLYYSGHGAQEETAGRFRDEQDGLLECLVCYSADEMNTSQLLADKEIRYLLSKLPNSPHLVTIFDACHSGDIVRAFTPMPAGTNHDRIRRISYAFEARADDGFVFSGDAAAMKQLPDGRWQINIPYKNHINLSACLASESAWEDNLGGVFTRYLKSLVERTEGRLSYSDIARYAKLSLQDITTKKQTPIATEQGKGDLTLRASWLKLHPEGTTFPETWVQSKPDGWYYNRGSLLGVNKDMDITIRLADEDEVTVKIESVEIDRAKLKIPLNIINRMPKTEYPASTTVTTFSNVKVNIQAIDHDPEMVQRLTDICKQTDGIDLVDAAGADVQLNIFNQFAYFSWPGHDFQPLAIQMELEDPDQLASDLRSQLNRIRKWQHFFTLENPANDFDKCPIRVTIKAEGAEPVDITNGEYRLTPQKDRDEEGRFYQHSEIRIENLTKKPLFVGVVALGSDIGISSYPFEEKVEELGPGESKQFYDHSDGISKISLDRYKEIYNWKEEWFYYKFIYNNFEDFSTALYNDFLQDPLPNPLLLETLRSKARGEGGSGKQVRKKWGTCIARMELANPNYNKLTEALQGEAEGYAKSEELGPFIKELYFDQEPVLGSMNLTLKQNQQESAAAATSKATDSWIVRLFNRIYKRKRRREFLRYQQTGGPIVIAEGDSWFLFPKPGVRDTLDYIMEKFHLLALAEAGDEVSDYLKNDELLVEVEKYKPAYALISGGGNDILGEEVKSILRDRVQGALRSTDHLDLDAFLEKMNVLKKGYIHFIEGVKQRSPGTRVFIHGYDYVRSNPDARTIKKGWANRYMIDYGISDHAIRKEIIAYLVDTFNDMLKALADSYDYVTYIDNRGTVHEDQWMDEIHPNNIGFEKVAANFLAKM